MLIVESGLFWLVLLLPLATCVINMFWGRRIPKVLVAWLACGSVGLAFFLGLLTFFDLLGHAADNQRALNPPSFVWFTVGQSVVDFRLLVDPLAVLMVLIVTGVGLLIHVYSVGYMWEDPGFPRFFTYMNLFIVAMLLLVTADNYLLLLVGWEGVGLCSYFLISFWYQRNAPAEAGVKAFVVNAIGDVGILIAAFILLGLAGSVAYEDVFKHAAQTLPAGGGLVTVVTLLLVLGAIAKSAQIPLYTWLPDAMEGPTPVSALIHAATMVAAGVYLLVRSYPLLMLAPVTMEAIAAIGAITLLFSATIGLTQFDIKRVLAYSTISQLGYMFLAVGVGGFASAMFHLTTHAFFKALLFLAAGSVIHALGGEQDMRKMGGLFNRIRGTGTTFLIGALALMGLVPFAGFFSKDAILGQAIGHNLVWYAFGLLTTFLTAFYVFRLYFMTFTGPTRMSREVGRHVHESPPNMMVPLYILAFFSFFAGFIQIPGAVNVFNDFLSPTLAQYVPQGTAVVAEESFSGFLVGAVVALVVGLLGLGLAYAWYVRDTAVPARVAADAGWVYNLVAHKYYVDEVYDIGLVRPSLFFSDILASFLDNYVIDGMVTGVASITTVLAGMFRQLQTGYVRQYALTFLLGAIIIVGYVLFTQV